VANYVAGTLVLGGTLTAAGAATFQQGVTVDSGLQVGGALSASGPVAAVDGSPTAGALGVGAVQAAANEAPVPGSGTIISLVAPRAGFYRFGGYYRVSTATTSATLAYSWADTDGAHSTTVQALAGLATGVYTYAPLEVHAASGATLAVVSTATTSSVIFASTYIEGIA